MKLFVEKHRLVVGDFHSLEYEDAKDGSKLKFDRKLYARSGGVGSLLSYIGESKTNQTDQMKK